MDPSNQGPGGIFANLGGPGIGNSSISSSASPPSARGRNNNKNTPPKHSGSGGRKKPKPGKCEIHPRASRKLNRPFPLPPSVPSSAAFGREPPTGHDYGHLQRRMRDRNSSNFDENGSGNSGDFDIYVSSPPSSSGDYQTREHEATRVYQSYAEQVAAETRPDRPEDSFDALAESIVFQDPVPEPAEDRRKSGSSYLSYNTGSGSGEFETGGSYYDQNEYPRGASQGSFQNGSNSSSRSFDNLGGEEERDISGLSRAEQRVYKKQQEADRRALELVAYQRRDYHERQKQAQYNKGRVRPQTPTYHPAYHRN